MSLPIQEKLPFLVMQEWPVALFHATQPHVSTIWPEFLRHNEHIIIFNLCTAANISSLRHSRFGIHKFSVVSTQDHFPTGYTIWREIGVLIKPSVLLISHFSRFCFSWLTVQYFPTVTKLSFVATSLRLAGTSLWRETQLSLVKTASGHRKFPSAETLHQEQISQVTRHHFVM